MKDSLSLICFLLLCEEAESDESRERGGGRTRRDVWDYRRPPHPLLPELSLIGSHGWGGRDGVRRTVGREGEEGRERWVNGRGGRERGRERVGGGREWQERGTGGEEGRGKSEESRERRVKQVGGLVMRKAGTGRYEEGK